MNDYITKQLIDTLHIIYDTSTLRDSYKIRAILAAPDEFDAEYIKTYADEPDCIELYLKKIRGFYDDTTDLIIHLLDNDHTISARLVYAKTKNCYDEGLKEALRERGHHDFLSWILD